MLARGTLLPNEAPVDRDQIKDLATCIYPHMIYAAKTGDGRIYYSDLCDKLVGRWGRLSHRDPVLAEALGDIVGKCKAVGLPALSAVVVGIKTGYPGNGYFDAAYPHLDDKNMRLVEWGKEFEKARRAARSGKYPARL